MENDRSFQFSNPNGYLHVSNNLNKIHTLSGCACMKAYYVKSSAISLVSVKRFANADFSYIIIRRHTMKLLTHCLAGTNLPSICSAKQVLRRMDWWKLFCG